MARTSFVKLLSGLLTPTKHGLLCGLSPITRATTGELMMVDSYRDGFAAGQKWAEEATADQLRRLEEYIETYLDGVDWFDVSFSGWLTPHGASGWLANAIMEEGDYYDVEEFWEDTLGDATLVEAPNFLRGFGERAIDVHRKAQLEWLKTVRM